jgi:Ca2+/Na+ antiporter
VGKFYELMILLGIAGIFQMVDVSVGTISYEIDTMFMNRLVYFCIMIWGYVQWRDKK